MKRVLFLFTVLLLMFAYGAVGVSQPRGGVGGSIGAPVVTAQDVSDSLALAVLKTALGDSMGTALADSFDVYLSVSRDTLYVNVVYGGWTAIGASTFTPSLTIRANEGGAGADSLFKVTFVDGSPVLTFNDADGNPSMIATGANFAGLYQDGGGSLTVLLVNGFEKVTTFDTDMPDVVSNGAHGTDDIIVGATGVYEVTFSAGATSAANNKTFEFFVFELDASPIGTAITSITKANPAVVTTSSSHGLSGGERVKLTGVVGMTEVEDNIYTVVLIDADEFSLDVDDGTDVNSGAYGSVGTDGLVYIATEITQVHSHRKFGVNSDQGAFGGSGLVSLTINKTLELFFKGTDDNTNLTIGECSFYMKRIQ